MISTPTGISGESASMIAATEDTIALTTATGGELIETIAPIAIPAHSATEPAAIGVTKWSSLTAWPNQVHVRPTSAMYTHRQRTTACGARLTRSRISRAAAAMTSSTTTTADGISGLSVQLP